MGFWYLIIAFVWMSLINAHTDTSSLNFSPDTWYTVHIIHHAIMYVSRKGSC